MHNSAGMKYNQIAAALKSYLNLTDPTIQPWGINIDALKSCRQVLSRFLFQNTLRIISKVLYKLLCRRGYSEFYYRAAALYKESY